MYTRDCLLSRLPEHDTHHTPREVTHAPEGIDRKHERKDGNGENVKHHPSDHVSLAAKDEHKSLKTIHGTNYEYFPRGRNDQVNDLHDKTHKQRIIDRHNTHISHGDGLNQHQHQIHQDDKSHRETAETTKVIQEHRFSQVVDR